MMIKSILFFILCLCFAMQIFAQNAIQLSENQVSNYDGLGCGYNILNEQVKEIGKENYARFELSVYITNQSSCPKIVLLNDTFRSFSSSTPDPSVFGIFDCLNATGKRLTSKNATVRAKQFFVPSRITEKNAEGKDVSRTISIHVGYILRQGESISNNITVILPEGERPNMQCRIVVFSNL
jgi:hypothetical protein